MMYKIYKLNFKSPLHIGIEGFGAESIEAYIPSDTLAGAIISCWFTLYEIKDKDGFCSDLPFKISSAFPFYEEFNFLPIPVGALDYLYDTVRVQEIKKIKKIIYAEKSCYEKMLNSRVMEFKDLNISKKNINTHLLYPLEYQPLIGEPFYKIEEIPRVTINRANDSSTEGEFFYFSQMSFYEGAGLFFLAEFTDENTEQNFDAALLLLGDQGIGADRNVGKGFFSFSKESFEIDEPEEAKYFTTLSLYHPNENEVRAGLLKKSAYVLRNRKGFAHNDNLRGIRRKSVRMFAEGSWFSKIDTDLVGDNAVVIDKQAEFIPFNVYRYGKAFPLSYKGFADE